MRLNILQKIYDMTLYLYTALRQFPRSERHTLAAEIKRSAFELARLVSRANKSRKKLDWLYQVDACLETLRFQVRLSMELGFLPFGKYEVLSRKLAEIGRMLGGWIRSES